MSASLIGRLGSSAFRLSTTTVSMSLAGSCFSSESAPGPLYGVFFVKELARAAKLSFVGFLVRSQSLFLRPDLRIADVDARRICTRLAVTPTLRHASPLPGLSLTTLAAPIRLIQKWLKAGVLEDGVVTVSDKGTGQGSVISPLLANLYLHYVLDLWA